MAGKEGRRGRGRGGQLLKSQHIVGWFKRETGGDPLEAVVVVQRPSETFRFVPLTDEQAQEYARVHAIKTHDQADIVGLVETCTAVLRWRKNVGDADNGLQVGVPLEASRIRRSHDVAVLTEAHLAEVPAPVTPATPARPCMGMGQLIKYQHFANWLRSSVGVHLQVPPQTSGAAGKPDSIVLHLD